jgi:hypothetical protein
MNKLLKFLPSLKSLRVFFDALYYVGFVSWFLLNIYNMVFNNHKITNEDLFITMIFIFFAIVDKIDVIKEK